MDPRKRPACAKVIELGKVALLADVVGMGAWAWAEEAGSLIGAFGRVTTFEIWQNFFRGGLSYVLYGPYPHEKETLVRLCAS